MNVFFAMLFISLPARLQFSYHVPFLQQLRLLLLLLLLWFTIAATPARTSPVPLEYRAPNIEALRKIRMGVLNRAPTVLRGLGLTF